MHLFDLLRSDGSIVVNKALAHEIGLDEAIIYSELVSMYEYWRKRDSLMDSVWFYCTIENLEENTTIKRGKQDRAIKKLEKLGLIETKRMGIPAKRYFRITDKIYELILNKARYNQIAQNEQTRLSKENKQDNPKQATNNTNNNTKENNTNDYLNLNPLNDDNKLDVLWNLSIPQTLKVKVKNKIDELTINQLLDLEQSYHYHLMSGNIVADTDYDDPEHLNDHQFSQTVIKMLDSTKDIHNIKGLVKSWVLNAISFKKDNILGTTVYDKSHLPNWLDV